MRESEFIKPVVRAQLTTSMTKPCTYFGIVGDRRVFVKGPYVDRRVAEVGKEIYDIKDKLSPGIAMPQIGLVDLVPDSFESETKRGLRSKLKDRKNPHCFQVSYDILTSIVTLPTKAKTTKIWSDPTMVLDWGTLKSQGQFDIASTAMFKKYSFEVCFEFTKHVLLSWIIGTTRDMSFRDFIIDCKRQRTNQVDNEAIGRYQWNLVDTVLAKGKFGKAFSKWVKNNWPEILAWLNETRINAIKNDIAVAHRVEKLLESDKGEFLFEQKQKNNKRKRDAEYDHWGYSCEIRIADLVSAIRCNNPSQALASFFAVYNLAEMYPQNAQAKTLRTLIIGCVVKTAIEDVGIANVAIVDAAIELPEYVDDPRYIAHLIQALCLSKKTRVHLHCTHAVAEANEDLAAKFHVDLEEYDMFKGIAEGKYDETLISDISENLWRMTSPKTSKVAIAGYATAIKHFKPKKKKDKVVVKRVPNSYLEQLYKNELEIPPLSTSTTASTFIYPEDDRYRIENIRNVYINTNLEC